MSLKLEASLSSSPIPIQRSLVFAPGTHGVSGRVATESLALGSSYRPVIPSFTFILSFFNSFILESSHFIIHSSLFFFFYSSILEFSHLIFHLFILSFFNSFLHPFSTPFIPLSCFLPPFHATCPLDLCGIYSVTLTPSTIGFHSLNPGSFRSH